MRTTLFKADERGVANLGWLKASYTFSFAGYFNPKRVHFGKLRVFNDDLIVGGKGFPSHTHENMEIITIPLKGAVEHKDSTGGGGVIKAGDVQIMSAGRGVEHSEVNHSATEELNLFQIWIFPKEHDIEPRYEQKTFDEEGRKNEFQLVVSPNKNDDGLWINQDAFISMIDLDEGNVARYKVKHTNNGVFLVVIEGEITFRKETLSPRDAIGIMDLSTFEITANKNAKVLMVDVPMH